MAIGAKKTATPTKRRFLKAKLIALGVVGLAGFIAVEAGWAGWGWAHLEAKIFPRDEAILKWLPADTTLVAIVDPHLVDRKAISPATSTAMDRLRTDIEKTTGVDLGFDVDKLAITPSVAVLEGRFNGKKIMQRMTDAHYGEADHAGYHYFTKKGEDAIAVIEDSVVLYGDEAGLTAAIDAKDTNNSLGHVDQVTDRLKQVGWDHALVITARINDDKPSVKSVLSGGDGPRAVTATVTTHAGVDLVVSVEAASPTAAEEIKKSIEERRQNDAKLEELSGKELSPIVGDAAKRASLTTNGATLTILVHLEADAADKLARGAWKAPAFAELSKSAKLLQLLGPAPR